MTKLNSFLPRIILPLMVFIILLVSCKTNDSNQTYTKAPIPEGKFVKIMVDVRLAESIIRKQSSKGENPEKITKQLYASLFKKYSITQKEFDSSIKLYSSNPDKMYEINEKIVEELSKMESEVKLQKEVKETNTSK